MALGDARLFSATISGFDGTALNPVTAGWRQILGTVEAGQDATHLTVIENGLVRIALDKNATTSAIQVFVFKGASWVALMDAPLDSTSWGQKPTITKVLRNEPRQITVQAFAYMASTNVGNLIAITVRRGIPAFQIRGYNEEGGGTYHAVAWFRRAAGDFHGCLVGTGESARDDFRPSTLSNSPSTTPLLTLTRASLGFDVVVAASRRGAGGGSTGAHVNLGNDAAFYLRYSNLDAADFPADLFIGFIPRTYGLGDGGGANVGNGGSGQLREAEDNYTAGGGASLSVQSGSNTSGGKFLRFSSIAVGHKASYSINFPVAGRYYVVVPLISDGSLPNVKVTIGGTSRTLALVNSDFAQSGCVRVFGPYDITSSGNKTVDLEISSVGTGTTTVDADYLAIFPVQRTTDTPAASFLARDLADSLLRMVTPA